MDKKQETPKETVVETGQFTKQKLQNLALQKQQIEELMKDIVASFLEGKGHKPEKAIRIDEKFDIVLNAE